MFTVQIFNPVDSHINFFYLRERFFNLMTKNVRDRIMRFRDPITVIIQA